MKEQLPCTLKLQQHPQNSTSCNSSATLNSNKASSHFYNTVKSVHATPSSSSASLYGNFYAYGKKGSGNEDAICSKSLEDDDLMVDVDLDPTYQAILDNFRKVMAQCS